MNYIFRILLVGECQTGKTSFLRRLTKNKFKYRYNRYGDIKIKKICYQTNKGTITLEFTDTVGTLGDENYNYYSSNDACMIFYNTRYKLKNNYVKKIKEQVKIRNGNIPFFIVGSFSDLGCINLYKNSLNITCPIFYISSKTGDGILYFLNYIVRILTNDIETILNTSPYRL